MGLKVLPKPPQLEKPAAPRAKPAAKKAPAKKVASPSGEKPKRTRKGAMEVFGFDDPRQGLLCAPKRYVDCTKFVEGFTDVQEEESALFHLRITGEIRAFNGKQLLWKAFSKSPGGNLPSFSSMAAVPKGLVYRVNRMELDVSDDRGNPAVISAFMPGGAWGWLDTKANQEMHVVGNWKQFGSKKYFNIEENVPERAIGNVWTRYGNMASLVKAERVELLAFEAKADETSWRHCAAKIVGECGLDEETILKKVEAPFISLVDMLKGMHEPRELAEGQAALECAKRISALAMQANALMQTARVPHPKAPIMVDLDAVTRMKGSQKEKLTADQENVVNRLCQMLVSPKAFSTLLSGDVGTGKTLAYLIPAIAAHQSGAQVAIMTPTRLLADQIFGQLQSRFGHECKAIQRVEAGDVIKDPGAILVGTAGLVSAAKKSSWLPNLLICDEQHKMSTKDRDGMVSTWTHVLHVSATPIPRSLATALYEGMEILNLRQSPVKKMIHSHVTDMNQKASITATLREAMSKGERCAIVYPAVKIAATPDDVTEELDAKEVVHTVESAFAAFDKAFPGKVVMLHGGMDSEDIRKNIDRMRRGEAQMMVASTVIETGIDIPSVSVMVVRNAENFGISQLHQLRGRLVRNGGEGDFIMAVEDLEVISPETMERLQAIASTTDGYELAERDLLQRGMGDFTGDAQSGSSKTVFRLVKLDVTDFMARKLKAVYVEAKKEILMPTPGAPAQKISDEVQPRLFG